MVTFLKNVAQSFDELRASGAEEVQLVITPRIDGAGLSVKYRIRTPQGWGTMEYVFDRAEFDAPLDPSYSVRNAMAEMVEKLQAALKEKP